MRTQFSLTLAASALAAMSLTGTAAAQDHPEQSHHEMDHSAMDHSAMDHGAMDHGSMDHGTASHGEMDHAAADQGVLDLSEMERTNPAGDTADSIDHAEMDHAEMDHGNMDHSGHHGMDTAAVPDQPGDAAAPLPPTDHAADAIFGPQVMAASRDHLYRDMHFTGFFIGFDLLEYRMGKGADGYVAEGETWYGGDIDRAVLTWSAEGAFSEKPEQVELAAYWRHAINPWFNLQLGARHDIRPDPDRTYAMIGVQGLAPYWIEVEAQAFVSEKGDVHLRATAMHDIRITQRLVLEPEVEIDVAMQDVPELGIGSGVDTFELAARLRYEIQRNFAPYVGVAWERKVGGSADFARDEGEDASRVTLLAGLRFWF